MPKGNPKGYAKKSTGSSYKTTKKKRIAAGSNERMRKPGTKGAPTAKAFKQSAKTAKKK
mgnify:CR=1 FL=1